MAEKGKQAGMGAGMLPDQRALQYAMIALTACFIVALDQRH